MTQPTYPETNTFSWEDKPRWMTALAIEMFRKQSVTGKNLARRKAYEAAAQALEDAEHEHGIESISSAKLKQLLTAAAQEHGWYAIDRTKLKQLPDPDVPVGCKFCRKCREVKALDDFKTAPSPAKARRYGWKEDTTQKVVHHLCTACRHKKTKERTARARYSLKHKFSELQLRTEPGLAARVTKYKLLHEHIAAHATRVRAAFSGVKTALHLPEGTVYEYQFATDELRQFYESKKVLLAAARDRLERLMGEAVPLPDTWGMLLTRVEQAELSELHSQACVSSTAARKPALWTLKLKEKDSNNED